MYQVACPSCGAPVAFRSAASVMAVCAYCKATLLKDAESVKDIGKMSSTLEDYSPIQITTSGIYHGQPFSVVGRIQLRYDAGFWNEWYVLFADGTPGWLSDASGQYIFTLPQAAIADAPRFADLAPGQALSFEGVPFIAADVRTAKCISGEGELPMQVGKGWEARAADFRFDARFLTLDYSDGDTPHIYAGKSVTLEDLRCQLLRAPDKISETAGKYRGKTSALSCPSCGNSIKYQVGMAFHIVCPTCHADVDFSTERAAVLKKGEQIASVTTTLKLGDIATVEGVKYNLIGLQKSREVESDESSTWVEYLLFNEKAGFLWLVESDGNWDRVKVLNQWPKLLSRNSVTFQNDSYDKTYDYGGEVIYAAGAFNWRISVGDRVRISDYALGVRKLSMEATANEITWSSATRVPVELVQSWFSNAPYPATAMLAAAEDNAPSTTAAKIFSALIVMLNLPITFGSGMIGLIIIVVALLMIWAPIWFPSLFVQHDGGFDGGDD